MNRSLSIGAAVLCLPSLLSGLALSAGERDFGELAKTLVPQIIAEVKAKAGDARLFRLAVFMPGDAQGKLTREMASPCQTLQGELIYQLRTQFKANERNRVLVLDKSGLQRQFLAATEAVDPSQIAIHDPQGTAKSLKVLQIDAAVVGHIDATGYDQVKTSGEPEVRITLAVVFQDGTFTMVQGRVDSDPEKPPESIARHETEGRYFDPPVPPMRIGIKTKYEDLTTCGRFAVEIFSDIDKFQKPLPLMTSKDPNSRFHNVYFLELPEEVKKAVEAGQDQHCEYRIRISNNGKAEVPLSTQAESPWVNVNDFQRLFAAVVLIDGVNTLYQDDGTGKIGPVVRHPKECRKWVLSGPGKMLVPGANRGSFQLVDATDTDKLGHSVIDITGFKMDLEKAAAFTFSRAEESIAETVGITNNIGLIEVHFYPQKMKGDTSVLSSVCTRTPSRAGPPGKNPVVDAQIELRSNACEVWRIYYCFKSPIPWAERKEVAFLEPQR